MLLTAEDLQAIVLTLQVAALTTFILLLIGTPLAWWLTRTQSWLKAPVAAITALPLVLPPSVLGFYLLVGMGPQGPVGQGTQAMGLGVLPFTFAGLVVGSVFYSLPFMVQPVHNAMQALGTRPLEVAATLRASPMDTFLRVVLPLCKPGLITGSIMSFAHTVGEFGVVLMVGGNIPGVTRVISVQIYDHVEALEYPRAHQLAALMLVFSFAVLVALNVYNQRQRPNSVDTA
jgi:molybdate transport system permease protein